MTLTNARPFPDRSPRLSAPSPVAKPAASACAPILCAKARGLPASLVRSHGKGAFLARLKALAASLEAENAKIRAK